MFLENKIILTPNFWMVVYFYKSMKSLSLCVSQVASVDLIVMLLNWVRPCSPLPWFSPCWCGAAMSSCPLMLLCSTAPPYGWSTHCAALFLQSYLLSLVSRKFLGLFWLLLRLLVIDKHSVSLCSLSAESLNQRELFGNGCSVLSSTLRYVSTRCVPSALSILEATVWGGEGS